MTGVLDHLVDEKAFYEDIRAAETDRERGEIVMEYLVSHLDRGYEPDKVDADWYEDIANDVEDATGLEAPDVAVKGYDDGGQMLYDSMSGMVPETPLYDFLGKQAEQMVPEEDDDWPTRFTYDINLQQELVPGRMVITQFSDGVCGVADPSGDVVRYSVPGIEQRADQTDNDYEDVRDTVMAHETVHAVQIAEYTELFDGRMDALDGTDDILDDPLGALTEILRDVDMEQVRTDPESVLHDVVNPMANPAMTLIEGHAEFYMDRAADTDLREDGEMERPDSISGKLWELTPMGAKKAQYRDGKNFFETLHDRGGNEYVHYTMQHPPDSMYDIRNPEQWADHVEEQLS